MEIKEFIKEIENLEKKAKRKQGIKKFFRFIKSLESLEILRDTSQDTKDKYYSSKLNKWIVFENQNFIKEKFCTFKV